MKETSVERLSSFEYLIETARGFMILDRQTVQELLNGGKSFITLYRLVPGSVPQKLTVWRTGGNSVWMVTDSNNNIIEI